MNSEAVNARIFASSMISEHFETNVLRRFLILILLVVDVKHLATCNSVDRISTRNEKFSTNRKHTS